MGFSSKTHMTDKTAPPHPETIKALIRIEFKTARAFERAKGLPAYSVRDVLRGRSVTATAIAISEAVGKTVETLFPGRFEQSPPGLADTKSQKRDSHRLIRKAS
jgi:lambda repressor-like predicted transcriptional regulator